ncbi:MAG: hypothetical protein IPH20_04330 [Bacteroidales bacterium]|nr:hypothetical protein [Bacteroidales bacterium]
MEKKTTLNNIEKLTGLSAEEIDGDFKEFILSRDVNSIPKKYRIKKEAIQDYTRTLLNKSFER